jgi:deoxyinosine 3'endonuclease (endonuclease V)
MVLDEHVVNVPRVAPYEPGALFKRELPCIRAVLALNGPLDILVVDGYATLDPGGRPGLGAYVADAFNLPVIGVAKTPFRAATHAIEVIRGTATRPPLRHSRRWYRDRRGRPHRRWDGWAAPRALRTGKGRPPRPRPSATSRRPRHPLRPRGLARAAQRGLSALTTPRGSG